MDSESIGKSKDSNVTADSKEPRVTVQFVSQLHGVLVVEEEVVELPLATGVVSIGRRCTDGGELVIFLVHFSSSPASRI